MTQQPHLGGRVWDAIKMEWRDDIPHTWEDEPKYIVFKREDFEKYIFTGQPYAKHELKDAVVIRRQDKFASPCLFTYAAMIGMVAMEHPDNKVRTELLAISDYFHEQATLASDEGRKLPDL